MFSALITLTCQAVKRGWTLSSTLAIASFHIRPRAMAFNNLIPYSRAAHFTQADVFEWTYLFK